MTDFSSLSPAAQAIMDAYHFAPVDDELTAAAVLRAVVEHLGETHAGFDLADMYGRFIEADDLLAIAAELEGFNYTSEND